MTPVEGRRFQRRVRLAYHAKMTLGTAPILLLAALRSDGAILRVVLVALAMLAIADVIVGFVLSRRLHLTASFPNAMDLGRMTGVPLSVDWASDVPFTTEFAYGLRSPHQIGRASSHDVIETMPLQRGALSHANLRFRVGGTLGHAVIDNNFMFEFPEPLLGIPASVADPAVTNWLDRLTTLSGERELVGVRPYREGDRPSDIHWPSAARSEGVMVRDWHPEPSEGAPITIVATAPTEELLLTTLGRTRFAVDQALTRGLDVTVITGGPLGGHPAAQRIDTERQLHELLAHAQPGHRAIDTDGAEMTHSTADVLVITSEGVR